MQTIGLNGIFLKNQTNVSWGRNAKTKINPEKNGNWGSISNVMAKKSTEIKFKYKIAVNGIFSQKHYKCFLGTKCQRWPYLEKNGIWLTFKGPNVECYGSEIN